MTPRSRVITLDLATSNESGVDTGILIKPSLQEFENIVNSYINTPFEPISGWNEEGHHLFVGGMGISGFLSYYFSKDEGYVQLDRCIYANNVDDECLDTVDISEVKCAKDYAKVCGDPLKSPYDQPDWSAKKLESCHQLHRKCKLSMQLMVHSSHFYISKNMESFPVYEYRYQFENKFFNKGNKQKRLVCSSEKLSLDTVGSKCNGLGDLIQRIYYSHSPLSPFLKIDLVVTDIFR